MVQGARRAWHHGVRPEGEQRGPVPDGAAGAGQGGGWDMVIFPAMGNFRTSAPAAGQCLRERSNPLACRNRGKELLLLLRSAAQGGFCTRFHAVLAACYLSSLFPGCAQILPAYLNSHLFSHKIHFSPAALCCYDNRLALLLLSHPCFSCIRTLPLILQPCSEDMTSSFFFFFFLAEFTICSVDCFPRSVFSAGAT